MQADITIVTNRKSHASFSIGTKIDDFEQPWKVVPFMEFDVGQSGVGVVIMLLMVSST